MKIASWNVNSLRVRLPQVLEWLESAQPDVLALQETKLRDEDFPQAEIEAAGYTVSFAGQPTYNGVAVLSRLPLEDAPVTDLPGFEDPQRRVLGIRAGDTYILDLYVPNGQEVGSEKYAYKLAWLEKLRDWVDELEDQYPNLVLLGDFNIAPEDRDVHDPEAWHEKVLCSTPEREAFQALLEAGQLTDSYRLFEQPENSFSWWDYRAAGFRRNRGLRIDHILTSPALTERCIASTIDVEPRKWERPSDHAPVMAEFRE